MRLSSTQIILARRTILIVSGALLVLQLLIEYEFFRNDGVHLIVAFCQDDPFGDIPLYCSFPWWVGVLGTSIHCFVHIFRWLDIQVWIGIGGVVCCRRSLLLARRLLGYRSPLFFDERWKELLQSEFLVVLADEMLNVNQGLVGKFVTRIRIGSSFGVFHL